MKSLHGRPAALILAAAVLFGAAGASGKRPSPWPHPIRRLQLDNGIILLHQKDGSSALTSLVILVNGGRRSEPEGMAGIAYLTSRLMLEMPDGRSARSLMLQASPLSLSCWGDFFIIEVESLSGNFEDTLRILSRPLQDPLFSDIRIESLKKHMSHLRRREMDDPASLAHLLCLRSFFGSEGYGASPYGENDSVRELRSRDLSRFYESVFRTENILLAVVSDREAEDISSVLKKHLASVRPGGPAELRPVAVSDLRETDLLEEKETLQSFLGASFLLPALSPRIFALAALAESLLGNGAASRLWSLRQENRLAYNVTCNFLPLREAGVLEASLETENEKLSETRTAFLDVLKDLSAGGVESAELEAASKIALTEMLRRNEPKNARAWNMAAYEALGLGHDFLERIPALLSSITVEEMNAFLAEWLDPGRAVTVTIAGTRNGASPFP
ncbi:MAG: insulinase family protein [Candidatus Aminicenantes bacterium]|nr:insulinase family protein [Candidatus Aminicenantes bacterium]